MAMAASIVRIVFFIVLVFMFVYIFPSAKLLLPFEGFSVGWAYFSQGLYFLHDGFR